MQGLDPHVIPLVDKKQRRLVPQNQRGVGPHAAPQLFAHVDVAVGADVSAGEASAHGQPLARIDIAVHQRALDHYVAARQQSCILAKSELHVLTGLEQRLLAALDPAPAVQAAPSLDGRPFHLVVDPARPWPRW